MDCSGLIGSRVCSWPIKLSQNWPTILSHFFLYLYLNICHSP